MTVGRSTKESNELEETGTCTQSKCTMLKDSAFVLIFIADILKRETYFSFQPTLHAATYHVTERPDLIK